LRLLLNLPDSGKLATKEVERVLLGRANLVELDMPEKHFERIADAPELAPVAPDLVEDGLLRFGVWTPARIDVDEAELCALLIEGPGIDRLPKPVRRQRKLKFLRHGHGPRKS
jgi:hypothetical protein